MLKLAAARAYASGGTGPGSIQSRSYGQEGDTGVFKRLRKVDGECIVWQEVFHSSALNLSHFHLHLSWSLAQITSIGSLRDGQIQMITPM